MADQSPDPRGSGGGSVTCRCTHLSEFALVRAAPPPPPPAPKPDCAPGAFRTATVAATTAYAACVSAGASDAQATCACVDTFNCFVRRYAPCAGEVGARVAAALNGQVCTLWGACLAGA